MVLDRRRRGFAPRQRGTNAERNLLVLVQRWRVHQRGRRRRRVPDIQVHQAGEDAQAFKAFQDQATARKIRAPLRALPAVGGLCVAHRVAPFPRARVRLLLLLLLHEGLVERQREGTARGGGHVDILAVRGDPRGPRRVDAVHSGHVLGVHDDDHGWLRRHQRHDGGGEALRYHRHDRRWVRVLAAHRQRRGGDERVEAPGGCHADETVARDLVPSRQQGPSRLILEGVPIRAAQRRRFAARVRTRHTRLTLRFAQGVDVAAVQGSGGVQPAVRQDERRAVHHRVLQPDDDDVLADARRHLPPGRDRERRLLRRERAREHRQGWGGGEVHVQDRWAAERDGGADHVAGELLRRGKRPRFQTAEQDGHLSNSLQVRRHRQGGLRGPDRHVPACVQDPREELPPAGQGAED